MRRIRFGVWAAMVFILVPLAGAQSYSVTDLGTLPGGDFSISQGINDRGQVTGYGAVGSQSNPFLWTAALGIQDLGTLSGDPGCWAAGINNSGEVVGGCATPDGTDSAFLWTRSNGMQNMSPGTNCFASGVNDSGEVVGYYDVAGGVSHAFLWTATGGIQDLGTLGGTNSYAQAINVLGQVVGFSYLADNVTDHAFLWTQAGGMQDIDASSTGNSFAYAINAAGEVAGAALTSSLRAETNAFVWTQSRGIKALGAGPKSAALGINDSGAVVGDTGNKSKNESAFLWTPDAGVQNLNSLISPNSGWALTQAWGINQSGQIAAYGTINGEGHAALLTPTN
jgi:probable HAF family extracellular repeat protein